MYSGNLLSPTSLTLIWPTLFEGDVESRRQLCVHIHCAKVAYMQDNMQACTEQAIVISLVL